MPGQAIQCVVFDFERDSEVAGGCAVEGAFSGARGTFSIICSVSRCAIVFSPLPISAS